MKLAAAFALAAALAAPPADELALTATSINVAEPGTPVKIKVLRWSTDDERAPLLSTLNPPARSVAGEGSRNPNPPATAGVPPGAGRNPAPAAAGGAAGRGR